MDGGGGGGDDEFMIMCDDEIPFADDPFTTQPLNDIDLMRIRRTNATECAANTEEQVSVTVYSHHANPEEILRRRKAINNGNMSSNRYRARIGAAGSIQDCIQDAECNPSYFDIQMQTLYDQKWNLCTMKTYREFIDHVAISLFVQDTATYPRLIGDIHTHIRKALQEQKILRHNKQELISILERSDSFDCAASEEFLNEVRNTKTLEMARFEEQVRLTALKREEEGYDEETVHADKRHKLEHKAEDNDGFAMLEDVE